MDAIEQPIKSTPARRRRFLGPAVRRRPSGEAPPLPRELGRSGKFWLFMAVSLVAAVIGVVVFEPLERVFERRDAAILRWFASWRSGPVAEIMTILAFLTSRWVIRSLRWATMAALIVVRRWRHLLVLIAALFVEGALSYLLAQALERPRPLDAWIIGPWQGFSMPSIPISGLAVTLIGITYSLIPHGRGRDAAKWAAAGLLLIAGIARVYLGADHATGAVFGAVLGVAIGLSAFRWFTPNDVFPVTYRRGSLPISMLGAGAARRSQRR